MDAKEINITYTDKNIFDCEDHSVIVHACNCKGSWGAGIARQIKVKYPIHYAEYSIFCRNMSVEKALWGSLLLDQNLENDNDNKKHWIGCLFTNIDYGSKNPTEEEIENILKATEQSLVNLICQIDEDRSNNVAIKDIHMPKINAGYFGVPWNRTEHVIKNLIIKNPHNIYVHTL